MSIIVTQIRLPYDADDNAAISAAIKKSGLSSADLIYSGIYKRSFDLRHGTLSKVFSVELSADEKTEAYLLRSDKTILQKQSVKMPQASGDRKLTSRPVVVGFGPAGMFASLVLAENGFEPIVIERGGRMDERDESVSRFFKTGTLDTSSNIQFGEGGAGAYSDGKLTTRINDRLCILVLELFEKHGASKDVLCLAKPHIGTDVLKGIVVSIRKRIEELGGSIYFNTCLTDISFKNFKVNKVITSNGTIDADTVVLAIGHSARDTVKMLAEKGVDIASKAFSVGFRIEHLRDDVNRAVYGKYFDKYDLPAAEYALSAKHNGRGCYSFCMCPGGYVIAAASEEGGVVTNGMSYHSRNGVNSNSAICVSVGPDDFGTPSEGIEFQRKLEREAFIRGGKDYCAPIQLAGDFLNGEAGTRPQKVIPTYSRGYELTDFSKWMPSFVTETVKKSLPDFAEKLSCFNDPSAVLTGVEARTSSPVRILRGDDMNSLLFKGLIPCGEGAGYAGGIMSAAVDGVRAAISVMSLYGGI